MIPVGTLNKTISIDGSKLNELCSKYLSEFNNIVDNFDINENELYEVFQSNEYINNIVNPIIQALGDAIFNIIDGIDFGGVFQFTGPFDMDEASLKGAIQNFYESNSQSFRD